MKNFVNNFKDWFFHFLLQSELLGSKDVLDVACGASSPLGAIKQTFISEGIDIFKPSIEISKKRKIHTRYKVGDIEKIEKYYNKKTFDTVICLDVVEHFTKQEGKVLMKKLEKIAKKKVVIMTPNGFYHQSHLEGNPHQEHKSGWKTKDFVNMGYTVHGLRGFKYLRGEHATLKYKPWIFWGLVAFISEPIFYFFPGLSYQLFAVKKMNEKI